MGRRGLPGETGRRGLVLLFVALVVPTYVLGVAVTDPETPAGEVERGTGGETVVTTQGLFSARQDGRAEGRASLFGPNGSERWRYAYRGSFFDATRLDNGTVLVAFGNRTTDCAPYDPPCDRTGLRVIDPDPQPHVVWEYAWTTRKANEVEVHDIEYLGNDTVVFVDMERERLVRLDMATRSTRTIWNASAFYTPPDDPTTRDWLHINDLDQIAPGRYLLSVRNANQLLVLEPQHGTTDRDAVREVINRDRTDTNDRSCHSSGALVPDQNGDVRCGDPAVLHRQHNPHWLGNGTVLVSDSENNRVVELHRAPNGTWQVAWATYRTDKLTYRWPRDADRRPDGTTLITDSGNHRVVLVDENGTLLRTLPTHTLPYEADLPRGESVTGPPVGRLDGDPRVDRPYTTLPVLTPLLFSLQHVVRLPWWFGELHLAGLIASAVVAIFGLGLLVGSIRSDNPPPDEAEPDTEGLNSKVDEEREGSG